MTSPAEGEDAVLAFDLTGKLLWQVKLGPENPPKHRTLGSSCNSSPVTDGKAVFVYFKSGHFAALDFAGKVLWKQNLTEQFGRENLFWDQGSSPVVTERHVIVSRMAFKAESWVAGFDKATGEVKWKVARNYKAPLVMTTATPHRFSLSRRDKRPSSSGPPTISLRTPRRTAHCSGA